MEDGSLPPAKLLAGAGSDCRDDGGQGVDAWVGWD